MVARERALQPRLVCAKVIIVAVVAVLVYFALRGVFASRSD